MRDRPRNRGYAKDEVHNSFEVVTMLMVTKFIGVDAKIRVDPDAFRIMVPVRLE